MHVRLQRQPRRGGDLVRVRLRLRVRLRVRASVRVRVRVRVRVSAWRRPRPPSGSCCERRAETTRGRTCKWVGAQIRSHGKATGGLAGGFKGAWATAEEEGSALAHDCGTGGRVVLPLARGAAVSTGLSVRGRRRGGAVAQHREAQRHGVAAVVLLDGGHAYGTREVRWRHGARLEHLVRVRVRVRV